MTIATVGWIGAGVMGRPMAEHLLRAGFQVVLLERASSGVAALVESGAQTAPNARAVAERADVVFTMLPETDTVEHIVLGAYGVRAGLRPGTLFVDMSSIAPATSRRIARELAAGGVDAVDAPVSGGEQGAREATLSIMAGGTPAAFERAEPLLRCLGSLVVHVGEAGAGQVAKAVAIRLAVAINDRSGGRGARPCRAAGVDAAKVRMALGGGLARKPGSRALWTPHD